MERQFGNDTSIIEYENFFSLISVHTSNSAEKFVEQWTNIKRYVDLNPKVTFVICGDFNARPMLDGATSVKFFNKDKDKQHKVLIRVNFDRLVNVTSYTSTTGKVRCLTAQFGKMLDQAFASIDGFITVSPVESTTDVILSQFAGYIDSNRFIQILDEPIYPPLSWPSDHALVEIDTPFGKICSMNAFGESIESTTPVNIFEIFTKRCWDLYQSNESIRNEFEKIKSDFMSLGYQVIGSPNDPTTGEPEVKSIQEFSDLKHFAKVSRKYAVAGAVFKPPRAFDGREHQTDFYNHLTQKYNNAMEVYRSDVTKMYEKAALEGNLDKANVAREISHVIQTILEFYRQYMESPILEPFFNDWFLELERTTKSSVIDVLKKTLFDLKPKFFCLQEVSEGMMESIKSELPFFETIGYRVNIDFEDYRFILDGQDNKTRGLIFYSVV